MMAHASVFRAKYWYISANPQVHWNRIDNARYFLPVVYNSRRGVAWHRAVSSGSCPNAYVL